MPELSPAAAALQRHRGALLIAGTCLATGVALAAGRQLLVSLAPPLTPAAGTPALQRERLWSLDPQRRRDAALILSGQPQQTAEQQRRLLRGQGHGRGTLAAVALKRAALAAEASGQSDQARWLWQELQRRFPDNPASADALYALGREQRPWRQRLLQRFPAHPAALAAALEAGDAQHLAHWGPRWPGAEALLRRRCSAADAALSTADRRLFAAALAQLGDGNTARRCLGAAAAPAPLQLQLALADLRGNAAEEAAASRQLLALAQRQPRSHEGAAAAAELAQHADRDSTTLLLQLPRSLQQTPAVQARLALEGKRPWQAVLQRWPRDPASWELQWELARRQLLQRRWPEATAVLASLTSHHLPAPLAARHLFWQGYSAQQQGLSAAAQRTWQQLLRVQPSGYYAWRARVRLGESTALDDPRGAAPATTTQPAASAAEPWRPLASGDASIDALWRVGQPLEAWEHWRHRQGGRAPRGPEALLVEGRLRTAIGDDWTGLGQLELASLRLPQRSCRRQWELEQQQHPRRYSALFARRGQEQALSPALLLGVAKQESRFSPGVSSAVGATGLLQLMPETAAELAGRALQLEDLQDPELNTELGARYLRQLLDRWNGNPFLAVASYNAGPGAVQSWLGADRPSVQREPELWTEAIPYPETRLYAKKVLGNAWSYQQSGQPPC